MLTLLVSRRRAKAASTTTTSISSELNKLVVTTSLRQFKLLASQTIQKETLSPAHRSCLYISFCISSIQDLAFKLVVYPDDDFTALYNPAKYRPSEEAVIPMVEVSNHLLAFFPPQLSSGSASSSFNPVPYDYKVHLNIKPWKKVTASLKTDAFEHHCSPDFLRAYLDGIAISSGSCIPIPFKSGPSLSVEFHCEGETDQEIGSILISTFLELTFPEPLLNTPEISEHDSSTYMTNKALDLEYLLRQRRNFPIHAVLVHGPAGSGKTHMVEQVSNRLGFKLVHITASDILDMPTNEPFLTILKNYIQLPPTDESQSVLRSKIVDVVLFLDDVDVLMSDDEVSDLESQRKVQIQFEALVDAIRSLSVQSLNRVVVIATSNNPNAINASTRNLFERELAVSLPTVETRLRFLLSLLKPLIPSNQLDGLPIEEISNSCHGYSLADLENLVRLASTRADLRSKRQSECSIKFARSKDDDSSSDDETTVEVNSVSSTSEQLDDSPTQFSNIESPSSISSEDLWAAKKETSAESMKSDLHLIPASTSRVDVSQLGGLETQYNQLLQSTVWIYKYGDRLAKMGVSPPRGILLFGPPGTGKTMLAKCVASASNANFLSISISDLVRGEIGGTEEEISKVFKIARAISPTIIFLDEIQALFGSRDATGNHGKNMISQLLLEMDGLTSQSEVVVIGATNRPDWIDSALLRPGRFERCLYIPPPSEDARLHILKTYLEKIRFDPVSINEAFLKSLTKRCERFSGADLSNLCLKAAWKVIQEQSSKRVSTPIKTKFGATIPISPPHIPPTTALKAQNEPLKEDIVTSQHFLSALSEFSPTITSEMIRLYEAFQSKYGRAELQQAAQGDPFAQDSNTDSQESQLTKIHLNNREQYRKERMAAVVSRRR